MSSSRGAKLILPCKRLTGSGLTWPFNRNLEIQRSTVISQTPKKNKASATEFWRIWTNHMTHHRRSTLYGAGLMGDYIFLLIFNTHISFQSCNRRSAIHWHSLFSPTTFFEIGVFVQEMATAQQITDILLSRIMSEKRCRFVKFCNSCL